jgi:hypothetical protein
MMASEIVQDRERRPAEEGSSVHLGAAGVGGSRVSRRPGPCRHAGGLANVVSVVIALPAGLRRQQSLT